MLDPCHLQPLIAWTPIEWGILTLETIMRPDVKRLKINSIKAGRQELYFPGCRSQNLLSTLSKLFKVNASYAYLN